MPSSTVRHVLIYAVVLGAVGAIIAYARSHESDTDDEVPGFEDLEPCRTLTSLDSKKTLYLTSDHKARFSDESGLGMRSTTGTWTLVDDDSHTYSIEIDGVATTYTLITQPAGEGCMLAAGRPQSVDLTKSWFSALTDPKD